MPIAALGLILNLHNATMPASPKFASRLFIGAGCYGILALAPLYFLEDTLGQIFPPAGNRPEHFYGFVGVALAWQLAFFVIATDVRRYRLMMLPAAAEKLLAAVPVFVLFSADRVAAPMSGPALIDLLLGCLFLFAFRQTNAAGRSNAAVPLLGRTNTLPAA